MPTIVASDARVARRPLLRREFDALVRAGAFAEERVELLGGELIEVTPQGSRHAWIVERLTEIFVLGLAGRLPVRVQLPLAISDDSEPEPDIAVTDPTSPEAHPTTAHLVVEVSETSLVLDVVHKAPRYASADVSEYWVVDVAAGEVVVHREPVGESYRVVQRVGSDQTLTFLGVEVRLASILA